VPCCVCIIMTRVDWLVAGVMLQLGVTATCLMLRVAGRLVWRCHRGAEGQERRWWQVLWQRLCRHAALLLPVKVLHQAGRACCYWDAARRG
jgi:hypothetical protein